MDNSGSDEKKVSHNGWLSFWVGLLAFMWGGLPVGLGVWLIVSEESLSVWGSIGYILLAIVCWFVSHNYISRIKS